jgi:polyisoprenoid-binding protein YceI
MRMSGIAALLALAAAAPASADWVLDNDASRINFITTKANTAAEVHTFGVVDGDISGDGKATISIDLDSVDTAIDIRDERMRTMLFETESYPTATLVAMVDTAAVEGLAAGETAMMTSEGQLMVHGTSVNVTFDAVVSRLADSRILVSSYKPVIINAPEVGLAAGVEKLREVAGLPSISPAVPVTFSLAFDRDD